MLPQEQHQLLQLLLLQRYCLPLQLLSLQLLVIGEILLWQVTSIASDSREAVDF